MLLLIELERNLLSTARSFLKYFIISIKQPAIAIAIPIIITNKPHPTTNLSSPLPLDNKSVNEYTLYLFLPV